MPRKCLGLEAAFHNCRTVSDWLRPKEGTPGRKDWLSKVDWRAADRVDPARIIREGFQHEGMDKEMRGEMEHDALVSKATQAMNALIGPSPDPINLPGS